MRRHLPWIAVALAGTALITGVLAFALGVGVNDRVNYLQAQLNAVRARTDFAERYALQSVWHDPCPASARQTIAAVNTLHPERSYDIVDGRICVRERKTTAVKGASARTGARP